MLLAISACIDTSPFLPHLVADGHATYKTRPPQRPVQKSTLLSTLGTKLALFARAIYPLRRARRNTYQSLKLFAPPCFSFHYYHESTLGIGMPQYQAQFRGKRNAEQEKKQKTTELLAIYITTAGLDAGRDITHFPIFTDATSQLKRRKHIYPSVSTPQTARCSGWLLGFGTPCKTEWWKQRTKG